MKSIAAICVPFVLAIAGSGARAADDTTSPPLPSVPSDFSIELVAGPPLVERPISAAFDDDGHLYVTESSGSNDPVEKQLELRPHRILRLEDSDGDGRFERRTIFADRMMILQGALFWRGSLYVAAPPSIWKLTDTDGDGVADERTEWFQGGTLTGCANDLHGPYLGPDGWLYWCKGAFAEQTHMIQKRQWNTRAAHVFRSRPDGTGLEPVLTGGMDNPVGLVFTPEGERILSATFLAASPRVDGLVHAVYGGVWGKEHGVLDGHPRTGNLMPALVGMSAAAPCGIERYDSQVFGAEFRDNVFVCHFNLRKVSRHILHPSGSSFSTADSDFVTSEHVDFHPTDVLMDADGSLLVVDTGGWYKLCCPTSTLWKPDVLGGVYRVRRTGAAAPADPRGKNYAWRQLPVERLWALLADARPVVRRRALNEFVDRKETDKLKEFLYSLARPGGNPRNVIPDTDHLLRVWALAQLESAESRSCIRQLLDHSDEQVRQAALTAVSLYRDADALHPVLEILATDSAANRRVAAEALGRIGDRAAVGHLLSAAANADDRYLQHSITYALIEIADPAATQAGCTSSAPGTLCSALVALDQMPGGGVEARQVISLLDSADTRRRDTARWLVSQHPEWGSNLAEWFRGKFSEFTQRSQTATKVPAELERMLLPFVSDPSIQGLLAGIVIDRDSSIGARALALRVMSNSKLREPPDIWRTAVASALAEPNLRQQALAASRELPAKDAAADVLNEALTAILDSPDLAVDVRIAALAVAAPTLPSINDSHFELLLKGLSADETLAVRSAAVDGISKARLSLAQLQRLSDALSLARPLEINQLLTPFARTSDEQLGLTLLRALKKSPAAASLRFDVLREALRGYGPRVHQALDELEQEVNVDAAVQRKRLQELLPILKEGDVRRGHAVFYSAKAACSACHRLGYAGGTAGPDLTRIGEIRSERDLLESILYPSLSFVRGYEPVLIITVDGRVISGVVRDETESELFVATGPDDEVRLRREEIEEMQPGTVSIMPAGLDQQLTLQQLADLVAFLKNTNPTAAAR